MAAAPLKAKTRKKRDPFANPNVLHAPGDHEVEEFKPTSVIEKDEKLPEGAIMRWCASEKVNPFYYLRIPNQEDYNIHPAFVRANKAAIIANKRGQ